MKSGERSLTRYRPSVFRRGLLVVLIPGLLSSCFLLVLNQFWQSTALAAKQEQSRSAAVLNLSVCFNALITYCYDVITLSFDNSAALAQRQEQDKQAFLNSLERVKTAPVVRANAEVQERFTRYAVALSRQAEALSAQMSRESFHSNITRFIRYRGFMARGAAFAEFLHQHFVAEIEELGKLRGRLESMRKDFAMLASIGLPVVLIGSLLALYFFARDIFLKVRSLSAKASAFPNIPQPEKNRKSVDEFGYLEEVLAGTAEDVREASERRQSFVQMLAHDMRSPIMATQVHIEILQEMSLDALSQPARQMCTDIRGDLCNVHDFVSDLLTAEKLECEPIQLEQTEVSLLNVVEAAQLALMDLADSKDIAIEYDAVDVHMQVDHERFLQAVICFLKAALQAALPGSIISIGTSQSGAAVSLIFKFTGGAISDKGIVNLFDPFHAEEMTNAFDMSNGGLNLRIARLIVEAHGGSAGGKGDACGDREYWLKMPLAGDCSRDANSSRPIGFSTGSNAGRDVAGWKDLLRSSSFRNCVLIFSLAFVLQASWVVWLGARIVDSEKLARQTALQSDTVFSLNKLWLELVLANNRMGFYLAASDKSKLVLAKENLAAAEALIGSLNQIFQERGEHLDAWPGVRSFVADELSSLKTMIAPSEDEQTAMDLGVLGSRIEKSGEINARMHAFSDVEIASLAAMNARQTSLQGKFQGVIMLAILSNLLTMAIMVWLFSRNISARLDQLVKVAKQIPTRQPITQMIAGNDEIYQVYWLLCRAALNLKDASDQRKVIMQMLADNIGKPLSRVESNIADLAVSLPEAVAAKSRSHFQSANDNIKRLLALVDDLLLLDELETGSLKIEKKPCSAREVVEASISSVGGIALKKKISLQNNCVEQEFNADRKRLIQVLVNLLGNAIKFAPRDTKIVVDGVLRDEKLQFSVIDEGPGISKEDLEKVFARFYQQEEHKKQGFGLGLSICSLIVRSHGGEITAESEIGKGSKFIVTLPID